MRTVGLFNRWMSSSWSLTQFMSPFLFFTQRHNSFRTGNTVLPKGTFIKEKKKKNKFQLFFSIDLYLPKFWKKLFTVCVSSALIWERQINSGLISGFSQIHPLLENNQKKSTVSAFKNSFWVIIEPPDTGHKSVWRRKRLLFLGYQERELHTMVVTFWCRCVFRYMIHSNKQKGSGGGLEVRGMLYGHIPAGSPHTLSFSQFDISWTKTMPKRCATW